MLRSISSVCLLLALSLSFVSSGCDQRAATGHPEHAEKKHGTFSGTSPMKVVCTTGPVADMVRNVGGEHVNVTALMGPGVDPHLYKAVPSDIEQLDAADAIFYNGLHLEGRMADLFEQLAARKPTFAVTHTLVEAKDKRLRTPPEFAGHYDPHVWHDPKMW